MRRLALLLSLCAMAGACREVASPIPTVASLSGAPRLNTFANGPEDPGPIIRTTDDGFFLLLNTDRVSRLASLIRLPDAPADLEPCGGPDRLEPADLQLVFHKNGTVNQTFIGRDVKVFLYVRSSFVAAVNSGGLCNAIATQIPIAEGLVDFQAHDNDTFFSGVHADAFGWTAVGTVTQLADGAALRYQNVMEGVLAADGSLVNLVNRITVTAK